MRTLTACVLLALLASPAVAQERLPIIDMHLHAMPAALGPPPRATCTPMPASGLGSRPALWGDVGGTP